jgi:probable F420-dependent oxidoreductase
MVHAPSPAARRDHAGNSLAWFTRRHPWRGATMLEIRSHDSRAVTRGAARPCSEAPMLKFGISLFFTERSMRPEALAPELEQRGFESVWSGEHSHMPEVLKKPFPGDGGVKPWYYEVMDPFVTLTAAATVTRTLNLGTGVCLIPQRDPIQTAKLVASIDQVSKGRFLFGVGDGWNQSEIENHGVDFESRHLRAREAVEAMKAIWTRDVAAYHGQLVRFDAMIARPKPVRRPHPPVLVGGAFPYSARRAIRYGDGWLPSKPPGKQDLLEEIPRFRQMAAEAGRDPASLPITAWYPPRDLELMKRYRDLGVERVVFSVPSEPAAIIRPHLTEIEALMRATR